MKLTISFPDDVAKKVCRMKNPEEFVRQAVEKALDQERLPLEPSNAGESRWVRLVQRVEKESPSLGGYYEKFKQDLADVRRDFRFRHDEPE
jgi:ribosome recycling factor